MLPPQLTHLMFADELAIFGEAAVFKRILLLNSEWSNQVIIT